MSNERFKYIRLSNGNNLVLCILLDKEKRQVYVGFYWYDQPRFQNPKLRWYARESALFQVRNRCCSFNLSSSEPLNTDYITLRTLYIVLNTKCYEDSYQNERFKTSVAHCIMDTTNLVFKRLKVQTSVVD
jgi:hypothetical protein